MVSSDSWRYQKHLCIAVLFGVVAGYADVLSALRYQAHSRI